MYGHYQEVSVNSKFTNDSHIDKCPRTHMWFGSAVAQW